MSGGYAKRLTLNGLNTQDAELIIEVDGNAYPVKGTFLPGRLQDSESVYSITENHKVVWIFPDINMSLFAITEKRLSSCHNHL